MKNVSGFFLFAGLVLFLTSCSPRMVGDYYPMESSYAPVIAVLPFEVIHNGRKPRSLSEEEVAMIEEAESQAFQASLHNQLANRANSGKYGGYVDVQYFKETNRLLEEADISLRDSWNMPTEELASALGVDAVMRTTVYKTRYLTDLEFYGLHVARNIIFILSGDFWVLNSGFGPGNEVDISTSLVDGKTGRVRWSMSRVHQANWTNDTRHIIEGINRNISRRFPYDEL